MVLQGTAKAKGFIHVTQIGKFLNIFLDSNSKWRGDWKG